MVSAGGAKNLGHGQCKEKHSYYTVACNFVKYLTIFSIHCQ